MHTYAVTNLSEHAWQLITLTEDTLGLNPSFSSQLSLKNQISFYLNEVTYKVLKSIASN